MTKQQVEQKIKEILSKDKIFIGAKIEIIYTEKTIGNKSLIYEYKKETNQ